MLTATDRAPVLVLAPEGVALLWADDADVPLSRVLPLGEFHRAIGEPVVWVVAPSENVWPLGEEDRQVLAHLDAAGVIRYGRPEDSMTAAVERLRAALLDVAAPALLWVAGALDRVTGWRSRDGRLL